MAARKHKRRKARILTGAEASFDFTHWVKAMPVIKMGRPSAFMCLLCLLAATELWLSGWTAFSRFKVQKNCRAPAKPSRKFLRI
jgi:hypothetical protein